MLEPVADEVDRSLEWNYRGRVWGVVACVAVVGAGVVVSRWRGWRPPEGRVPQNGVTVAVLLVLLIAGAVALEWAGTRTKSAVEPPNGWLAPAAEPTVERASGKNGLDKDGSAGNEAPSGEAPTDEKPTDEGEPASAKSADVARADEPQAAGESAEAELETAKVAGEGPEDAKPAKEKPKKEWKTRRLWVAFALLAVPTAVFGQWARPSPGPNVIRLELAGSQGVAATLFCTRHQTATRGGHRVANVPECHLYPNEGVIHHALLSDVGFIVGYVLLLFLLVRWAGSYFRLVPVRRARVALSWAVVAAGAFDLAEDAFLWRAPHNAPDGAKGKDLLWELAATCAWVKFAVLLAVVGYVVCGAWAWLFTPRWVRLTSWHLPEPIPDAPEIDDRLDDRFRRTPFGIALSGGGIRAASISLGALQVLENDTFGRPTLGWDRASVVTAVSGGSNIAAGWSLSRSVYNTDTYGYAERVSPGTIKPQPWSALGNEMTLEEAHLFANLGYLLASSPRDTANNSEALSTQAQDEADRALAAKAQRFRPSALATVLAGFAVNVAVFVGLAWVVATPFGWMLAGLYQPLQQLRGPGYGDLVASHHLATPGLLLVAAGVLLVLVWVGLVQIPGMTEDLAAGQKKWRRQLLDACKVGGYSLLGLGAVLLVTLTGLPYLAGWLDSGGLGTLAAGAAGAAGVLGAALRILKKPAAKFAPYLGGVAFAVFAVVVAGAWVARAARLDRTWALLPGPGGTSLSLWLLIIAGLVLLPLVVSPEQWSLAGFYRSKLRIAYGTYRTPEVPAKGDDPRVPPRVEVYQNDDATSEMHLREPWLHSFRDPDPDVGARDPNFQQRVSTPLTVCGTVTVSSKSVQTHYGIPALSVTFDPNNVTVHVPTSGRGSWADHSAPTEVVNAMGDAGRKRLTTMMAVAIASAAVSPAMGRMRLGPTSMLLAFANVRLGVWMPNPRYANAYGKSRGDGVPVLSVEKVRAAVKPSAEQAPEAEIPTGETQTVETPAQEQASPAGTPEAAAAADRGEPTSQIAAGPDETPKQKKPGRPRQIGYPRTGLAYLFKEFLGIHDLSDPYLYMTDGGHWENTGLVEMLRRADVKEIVCIDADCGSLEATSSLGKALDLAPLECDVHLQVNLDPLRLRRGAAFGPGYAERTVTVGFFRRTASWGGDWGVLWYAKPGLTSDMSSALLGFRETHPDFPVISTADQFFDSSTYVAYRELGRHNARCIQKARADLVEFLNGLRLPAKRPTKEDEADQAAKKAVDDGVLKPFQDELETQAWVVRELAATAAFMLSDAERVWFLVCVKNVLAATDAAAVVVDRAHAVARAAEAEAAP